MGMGVFSVILTPFRFSERPPTYVDAVVFEESADSSPPFFEGGGEREIISDVEKMKRRG